MFPRVKHVSPGTIRTVPLIPFLRLGSNNVRTRQVMGILMKNHKAEMDGKLAQKLVTARLKGE